jgi:hypothetical protein
MLGMKINVHPALGEPMATAKIQLFHGGRMTSAWQDVQRWPLRWPMRLAGFSLE